jgi:cation transport protein ChaC
MQGLTDTSADTCRASAERPAAGEDIWIFGYGSLMWRPGFHYQEMRPALLRGYHRALCVYSHVYRGTPERPGLVLGLDRGGSCRGYAFRVAAAEAVEVLAYLDGRELPTAVYQRQRVRARLEEDGCITCWTYVVRRGHAQYAGGLPAERLVELILQGVGTAGTALDYLENTVRHLDELGLAEGYLHRLLRRAQAAALTEAFASTTA